MTTGLETEFQGRYTVHSEREDMCVFITAVLQYLLQSCSCINEVTP
jgi:hypothetical protein